MYYRIVLFWQPIDRLCVVFEETTSDWLVLIEYLSNVTSGYYYSILMKK